MDECHAMIVGRENVWSDLRVVPALLRPGIISVVATATAVAGVIMIIPAKTTMVIVIIDINLITNENILRGASAATAM